jgi:hypothetical protein
MVQGLNTGKNNLLQMNPILSQIMNNNEKKEEVPKPAPKEHHKEPTYDHGSKILKPQGHTTSIPILSHQPPMNQPPMNQPPMNQPQMQINQNMLLEQIMKGKMPPGGIPGFPAMPGIMPMGQPIPGMFPGIGMAPMPGIGIPGMPGLQPMPPNMMGGINPLFLMQQGMPNPQMMNPQMMGLLNAQPGGMPINLMNMMKDNQFGTKYYIITIGIIRICSRIKSNQRVMIDSKISNLLKWECLI